MKWFKHISDSLDDPFIFDLVRQFGAVGYLAFFGILEIYAREFQTKDGWKLDTSLAYLRTKLQQTRNKPLMNCLSFIHASRKWEVEIRDGRVSILIPKFRTLMDETTLKKMRDFEAKNSGKTPGKLRNDSAQDEDKELPPLPPKGCAFDEFWESTPAPMKRSLSKAQIQDKYNQALKGTLPLQKKHTTGKVRHEDLIKAIKSAGEYYASRDTPPDKYPMVTTWLIQLRWTAEYPQKTETLKGPKHDPYAKFFKS